MDNKKRIVASIRMSFDIIAKKNMPIDYMEVEKKHPR